MRPAVSGRVKQSTHDIAHRDNEHRNRNDGRVEHVRHVQDEDKENLRNAPNCRKPENGETDDRVPPRGGEVAPGRTHLQSIVRGADPDEERGKSRKHAKPEVNPERKINAHRRIGPTRKPHRKECRTGSTENAKRHVPRVNLDQVFGLDHLLHYTELGRSENGEENTIESQQAVCNPFGTRHITNDNCDNGSKHSHRRPCHHAALVEAPRKVARRRHHENGRREDGDLEQHAAPPEGRTFEREGEPTLEMDEKSHLDKNAAEGKNKEWNSTGVLA